MSPEAWPMLVDVGSHAWTGSDRVRTYLSTLNTAHLCSFPCASAPPLSMTAYSSKPSRHGLYQLQFPEEASCLHRSANTT
jgi:hypothetical protein